MSYNFQAALQSGLSPEEIKSYLISQGRSFEADAYFNQQQPKKPGIISRAVDEVKSSLNKRADNVSTALNSKQSKAEKVLQVGGQAAGLINDLIGTGAKTAIKTNLKIASNVTPDAIEKPFVDVAKKGARMIIQSPEGQAGIKAIQTGVDGYNLWKSKNPRAARNLESVVNIATLLPIGKAGEVAAREGADVAGQAIKVVGESALEVGNIASKAGETVAPVGKGVSKLFLGEDLQNAVSHFVDNTETVNAFRSGTKTYQHIADDITKATNSYDAKTFQAFQQMKQNLPEIKVPNNNVIGEVKKLAQETPALTEKEKSIAQGIMNEVRGNKNQTIKGLLDLRNRLDRGGFYRAGEDYINSNQFLREVRGKINEMAIARATSYDAKYGTNYANQIRDGLFKASSDIDFIEKLKTNLIGTGKSVEQTANKVRQILAKIDDPTEYEATKNLLKELEARTGVKVVNNLESAKAAKIINQALKLPGGVNPIKSAGTLLNKAAIKGAELFGKAKK